MMHAQALGIDCPAANKLFDSFMHSEVMSLIKLCGFTRLVRDDFKGQLGAFTPCFTDIVILGK